MAAPRAARQRAVAAANGLTASQTHLAMALKNALALVVVHAGAAAGELVRFFAIGADLNVGRAARSAAAKTAQQVAQAAFPQLALDETRPTVRLQLLLLLFPGIGQSLQIEQIGARLECGFASRAEWTLELEAMVLLELGTKVRVLARPTTIVLRALRRPCGKRTRNRFCPLTQHALLDDLFVQHCRNQLE